MDFQIKLIPHICIVNFFKNQTERINLSLNEIKDSYNLS